MCYDPLRFIPWFVDLVFPIFVQSMLLATRRHHRVVRSPCAPQCARVFFFATNHHCSLVAGRTRGAPLGVACACPCGNFSNTSASAGTWPEVVRKVTMGARCLRRSLGLILSARICWLVGDPTSVGEQLQRGIHMGQRRTAKCTFDVSKGHGASW